MSRLLEEKARIETRLRANVPGAEAYLYHGNSHPNKLRTLRPQFGHTMQQGLGGQFVFAASLFEHALFYTLKMDSVSGEARTGLSRTGGFIAHEGSPFAGYNSYYAMVGDYERLERNYRGGYVYGLKPDRFCEVDDFDEGEKVSLAQVAPEFAIRVNSPREVMEAGIQIFSMRDGDTADEIAYNWPSVVEMNAQEFALRELLLKTGKVTWVNRDLGIEVPYGPMCGWD